MKLENLFSKNYLKMRRTTGTWADPCTAKQTGYTWRAENDKRTGKGSRTGRKNHRIQSWKVQGNQFWREKIQINGTRIQRVDGRNKKEGRISAWI